MQTPDFISFINIDNLVPNGRWQDKKKGRW